MMTKTILALCLVPLLLLCNLVHGENLPDDCLGCLCQAVSQCDLTITCTTTSWGSTLCGPFQISKDYWTDGGSLTVQNQTSENAFETCALDPDCASKTVKNYMKRYRKDCNTDGVVNCDDYMLAHWLGGPGCQKADVDQTSSIFRNYKQCREIVIAVSRLNNP